MLTIFFADAVSPAARRGWLICLALLLCFEAILFRSILSRMWVVALLIGGVALCITVWKAVAARTSQAQVRPAPYVDQLFFGFIALASALFVISRGSSHAVSAGSLPTSRLLASMSLSQEFLTVFLLGTVLALLFPSWSDPALADKVRRLEHFPSLAFSRRRTLSALTLIGLFWLIGVLVLGVLEWPIESLMFLAVWMVWTITYWERLYGYQSRILYLYTAAAVALGGVGLILSSNQSWIRFIFELRLFWPVLALPLGILGYGTYYTLNRLWTLRSAHFIINQQRTSHTFMTILMSATCGVIYLLYIVLPIYDYWSSRVGVPL